MKKGFVLEGGAMRGLFTAGVLDVLMSHDIVPDGIVGVSAGAAFGCNVKSGQQGRALRYNKRFVGDSRYCGLRSLLTTGDLFNARFAYHRVPEEFDIFDNDTFCANPMEYYVVCSDVETGQPVYHLCTESHHRFYEWVRASASMPIVSHIVDIDGRKLLDGGLTDSIPLQFMTDKGYRKNIVILTRPSGYRKDSSRLTGLMRAIYRRYPNLCRAMEERHTMYNRQLDAVAESESRGESFVIRPPKPLPIGYITSSPEKLQTVYDIGVATAKGQIDRLSAWWNKE